MFGWKNIIDLQLTDETPAYESDGKSLSQLYDEHFEKTGFGKWIQDKLEQEFSTPINADTHDADLAMNQLFYLGLDDKETLVNRGKCSPADLLQFAVEKKLSLKPGDKDMIVMLHEFEYELENKQHTLQSSLVVKGENSLRTAMAKTVGLPLAIAAKLILNGQLQLRGLLIPTKNEIYETVLEELEQYDVKFREERIEAGQHGIEL